MFLPFTACMADFDLEKQICDVVEQFILSPAGRTRDVIAHLHTLIGYIVAMPVDKARSIFKIEGTNMKFTMRLFTLSHMINFRLFQIERVCRRQFQI